MKSITSLFLLVTALPTLAAEALPLRSDFWKDPAFLSSFNGSYRANAQVEPVPSGEERAALISIQDAMAKGQREAAIQKLKNSPLLNNSASLQFTLGNLYFESGNLDEADAAFQKALQFHPDFLRAHRNLAFTKVRLDQASDALAPLRRAIQLGDQDANSLGLLGYLNLQQAQASDALVAYQQASLMEPERADWKLGQAQALLQLDQPQSALPLLQELLKSNPTRTDLLLVTADVHLMLNQLDAAIAPLSLAKRLGNLTLERRLHLGQLFLRTENAELAKAELSAAFKELKPEQLSEALDALRFTLQLKSTDLASSLFEELQQRIPQTPDSLKESRELLFAQILIAKNDHTKAKDILENIVLQNPLNGEALLLLAQEVTPSDAPRAELLLTQASGIDPHAHAAWRELAKLFVSQARYAEAISAVEKALALRHDDALADYLNALKPLAKQQIISK